MHIHIYQFSIIIIMGYGKLRIVPCTSRGRECKAGAETNVSAGSSERAVGVAQRLARIVGSTDYCALQKKHERVRQLRPLASASSSKTIVSTDGIPRQTYRQAQIQTDNFVLVLSFKTHKTWTSTALVYYVRRGGKQRFRTSVKLVK